MPALRQNCDPNLPDWLCVVANVCGYISNAIWFLVLLPQILKNFSRKSTAGLSFIWASFNFCASLFNLFFILDIDVPWFTRISGWYMPILEIVMLLQFMKYSTVSRRRKVWLFLGSTLIYTTGILLQTLDVFGPDTSSKLVWVSIVLWSIETYFQIVLNMKRRSVQGQSYISMGLALVGKTTDVIMQFSLLMPTQYIYMTYFSSTLAYFNIMQLVIFTQRRWYTLPAVTILGILLGVFAALLILRTSIVSILCPIGVCLFIGAAYVTIRRWRMRRLTLEKEMESGNSSAPVDTKKITQAVSSDTV
ncbi:hypothetical protein BG004_007452 [Podila humilis]|nr:hypothetical protein BG004_007452 [Podila humilis]